MKVARARVDQGGALGDLAEKVGVALPTLQRWLERPAAPRLRPVTLEPAPGLGVRDPARPVLITPQGVRVEGLDGATLIAILRALA